MAEDLGRLAGSEIGSGERKMEKEPMAVGNANGNGNRARPERRGRRVKISAPVRVRGLNAALAAGPHEVSTTLDVSRSGLLFVSAAALFAPGMPVAVTFPYCKTATAMQAEKPGRVVRVSEIEEGRVAVAVELVLPGSSARAAEAAASGAPAKPHPDWNAAIADKAKPLVLLVDSDPSLRHMLKDSLMGEGYEVIAVHCAAEAHDVLNLFTPALLIAEIEGDDLPGYDLCARVKSTRHLQNVPVMLMTRSAFPSDYANAHSLGAVVCIAKPFRTQRLAQMARLLAPSPQARQMVGPQRPPARPKMPAKSARRNGFR